VVRPEATANIDDSHLLDGGCPTDPKGAWADVEENLNACEKRNHDQSWSPSRAVMSMTCRQTTAIIDPAVRMVSTMCELFLQAAFDYYIPVGARRLHTIRKGTPPPSCNRQERAQFTACPGLVKFSHVHAVFITHSAA